MYQKGLPGKLGLSGICLLIGPQNRNGGTRGSRGAAGNPGSTGNPDAIGGPYW